MNVCLDFAKKSAVVFALVLMAAFVSCSKRVNVSHDSAKAADIYGSWETKNKSEIELYSNPGTEDEALQGNAEILSVTELTFSESRLFKMKITTSVASVSLLEDAVFSEEMIRGQVDSTMEITGTYSCGSEYLLLKNEAVKRSNVAGDLMAEDSLADETTTVRWSVKDGKLELVELNGSNAAVYRRVE